MRDRKVIINFQSHSDYSFSVGIYHPFLPSCAVTAKGIRCARRRWEKTSIEKRIIWSRYTKSANRLTDIHMYSIGPSTI